MKNKDRYQQAFNQINISEGFKERTLQRLKKEAIRTKYTKKERFWMNKNRMIQLGSGLVAGAVLFAGVMAWQGRTQTELPSAPPSAQRPEISAMIAVNIEGIIDEVSEDGQSFRIGDLWVTVDENTQFGILEPTAPPLEEQNLSETFEVGNIVSGYTEDDPATGTVVAINIYNNFPGAQ